MHESRLCGVGLREQTSVLWTLSVSMYLGHMSGTKSAAGSVSMDGAVSFQSSDRQQANSFAAASLTTVVISGDQVFTSCGAVFTSEAPVQSGRDGYMMSMLIRDVTMFWSWGCPVLYVCSAV